MGDGNGHCVGVEMDMVLCGAFMSLEGVVAKDGIKVDGSLSMVHTRALACARAHTHTHIHTFHVQIKAS